MDNQKTLITKALGRPAIFKEPEDIAELAQEYFDWADKTPIFQHKIFASQGEIIDGHTQLARPYTVAGLCAFGGMSRETWYDYAKKEKFSDIINKIEDIMRDQKFAGATTGIFNANIIARDLGLTEKAEVEHSGSIANLSEEELDARIAKLSAND